MYLLLMVHGEPIPCLASSFSHLAAQQRWAGFRAATLTAVAMVSSQHRLFNLTIIYAQNQGPVLALLNLCHLLKLQGLVSGGLG